MLLCCGCTDEPDEPEIPAEPADFTGYTVIRSDTDPTALNASMLVKDAMQLPIATDWVKRDEAVPEDKLEVLVGATNRRATLDAEAELKSRAGCYFDYIIRAGDGKVVILGGSSGATDAAAEYFISELLPKLSAAEVEAGYEYIHRRENAIDALAGRSIGDYTICIPAKNDKISTLADKLQTDLLEKSGCLVPISTGEPVTAAGIYLAADGAKAHDAVVEELISYRDNHVGDWLVRAGADGIIAAAADESGVDAALDCLINEAFAKLESGDENFEKISRKEYTMLTLNGKPIGDYAIEISPDASVDIVEAAERLASSLASLTGYRLPVTRNASEQRIKIYVTDLDMEVGRVQVDDGGLVIEGGHYASAAKAVDELIDKLDTDVKLEDCTLETKFDMLPLNSERYPEMKLVWNDEFDFADGLFDSKKWLLNEQMTYPEVLSGTTERNVKTEDGNLVLRSWAEDEEEVGKPYSTNMSMTTRNSCNFRYGYLEMRAKVPYGRGCWPSFWMVQREDLCGDTPWMAEVDIFEVFGQSDRLNPNIHKWYWDNSREHVQVEASRRSEYVFKNEQIAEEYHTYGFYWDEKKMIFSVDGEDYCTMDITKDFGDSSGMAGFQNPCYIILNNYIFAPGMINWLPDERMIDSSVEFPITYTIDYMRLYQGGNGELIAPNLIDLGDETN